MKYQANQIYHVYNQGNNKQNIFFERENYLFFLRKMRKHLLPNANILCYCLMPNHFHILLVPKASGLEVSKSMAPNNLISQQILSQQIGILLSSYTKAINRRVNRTGSLFRGKTKSKDGWIDGFVTVGSKNEQLLFKSDNDYARQCFQYIHKNPVKANLVENEIDWEFSSAQDYAGIRKGTMCNYVLAKEVIS